MADVLMTRLSVNSTPVDLNEFARQFLTRIILCAVSMLKGGENVKSLVFTLEGEKAELIINDKTVPLSPFPRQALVGTVKGLASSLRGVSVINSLRINIDY